MLSKITLRNLANEDVVIHEDTPTSKRLVEQAKGLLGPGSLRAAKRVRPSADGSINQTRWEEGKAISLEGECVSPTSIEDAIAQFRAIAQVARETLEASEEKGTLLKWTEGTTGKELQRLVKLDSASEPILKEANGRLAYQLVLFAEDPRAYSQSESSHTATLTISEPENTWIGSAKANKGIAANSEHLYWGTTEEKIARSALAGTSVETAWLSATATVTAIAVNASNVFWTSSKGIGKATLAGASVEPEWRKSSELVELGEVKAIALDSGHIYFAWGSTRTHMGRMTLAGGSIEKTWLAGISEGAGSVGGVAVDSGHVYWARGGEIGRATLAGESIEQEWVIVGSEIKGLVSNGTYLYWISESGHIGRIKNDGTQFVASLLIAPFHLFNGLNVEGTHLYGPDDSTHDIARGSNSESETFTLTQNGNRGTPMTVKIHGPAKSPVIMRHSDGAQIALEGEIPAGNYIEINGGTRIVKLNGVSPALYYVNPETTNWQALELPAGSTGYSLNAESATAASVEMFWRDAYV